MQNNSLGDIHQSFKIKYLVLYSSLNLLTVNVKFREVSILSLRAKEKNKDRRKSRKFFSGSAYLHFIDACETVTVAVRGKAGLVWVLSNYDNERLGGLILSSHSKDMRKAAASFPALITIYSRITLIIARSFSPLPPSPHPRGNPPPRNNLMTACSEFNRLTIDRGLPWNSDCHDSLTFAEVYNRST